MLDTSITEACKTLYESKEWRGLLKKEGAAEFLARMSCAIEKNIDSAKVQREIPSHMQISFFIGATSVHLLEILKLAIQDVESLLKENARLRESMDIVCSEANKKEGGTKC